MSHTFRSIFDIIGPVMVGPSSSHTAGALALGKAAAQLFEVKPKKSRSIITNPFRIPISVTALILRSSAVFLVLRRMIR